jgi:hypothetical protein
VMSSSNSDGSLCEFLDGYYLVPTTNIDIVLPPLQNEIT